VRLTLVRRNLYHDSVALLGLARELRARPDIRDAAALMGTPANRELLAQSGLLTAEAAAAGPADLVVVAEGETQEALDECRALAEAFLAASRRPAPAAMAYRPRTLAGARRRFPEASLALISVPGAWAAAETREALARGLHVLLFSDNVPLEAEVELKRLARSRGLLLMGPDCGTAYLGGVPLGFANEVPRGPVGIVSASGTGLQQVVTLLAAHGLGPSHAIGVGGRDLSAEVGGEMTLSALGALARDPRTELLMVIGKPPAPEVRVRIEAAVRAQARPAVLAILGPDVAVGRDGRVVTVATLEDAAQAAVSLTRGTPWAPAVFGADQRAVGERVRAARERLRPGQRAVRGLYAGGTLAHEAALILSPLLGPIGGNLGPDRASPHRLWDLGADEFTRRRPHPMLDPAARIEGIAAAARDPATGVLLLDVVLGHGAAADPAGDIAPAIEAARAEAARDGRELAVVASIVGTDADPQGLGGQRARLEAAGVWVLPSNARAARAAACIVGGEVVLRRLLGAPA
jgi:FdrA protein